MLRTNWLDVLIVAVEPDALGLGLFSASGTELALAQGMPAIVAVLMGVITAAFGGILRDIVCNEIPRAFTDHRPCACSFAGGWSRPEEDRSATRCGAVGGHRSCVRPSGLGAAHRLSSARMDCGAGRDRSRVQRGAGSVQLRA